MPTNFSSRNCWTVQLHLGMLGVEHLSYFMSSTQTVATVDQSRGSYNSYSNLDSKYVYTEIHREEKQRFPQILSLVSCVFHGEIFWFRITLEMQSIAFYLLTKRVLKKARKQNATYINGWTGTGARKNGKNKELNSVASSGARRFYVTNDNEWCFLSTNFKEKNG